MLVMLIRVIMAMEVVVMVRRMVVVMMKVII